MIKEDINFEDIDQLKYLDAVIKENLRVETPSGLLINRKSTKDVQMLDMKIPKGTYFGISIRSIHYSEKYYKNPLQFDPNHFSDEQNEKRNPYAFIPFGLGPRTCIF
jgi:cytochrome P450